jgi:ribosomal-protein-alanine N-acetyltransferase
MKPGRDADDAPRRVRLMRPTERGAVRKLGAPLFEDLGGYDAALDAWLRHPAVVTVVADAGRGRPDGFALVGRLDRDRRPEAYLLAIGVAEGLRGGGVGRALLEAALEQAERRAARWGVDRIALDVAADNAPARALFAAAGFETLGPGEPYANGQPSLRMGRSIGARGRPAP